MRESLKERMRKREFTVGSWITLAHTSIAEIMSQAGFDWLVVDMEHSAITIGEAQSLIQTIELSGVTPLVRVGKNDSCIIKRVMDSGAHGVIVPMVNSREDAERAVKSVKYPPVGFRGVGLARAQKYGAGFEQYKNWAEKESIVVVQIEHIDAINNLEEILTVKGVDGFIVGPYDLSGSLGKPGEFSDPSVLKALEKVKQLSAKHNALSGFHVVKPDLEDFKKKKEEGYRFIAFGLDTLFLGQTCRDLVSKLKISE